MTLVDKSGWARKSYDSCVGQVQSRWTNLNRVLDWTWVRRSNQFKRAILSKFCCQWLWLRDMPESPYTATS
eukprot:scaffold38868_cov37-Attheya_sp.AAC.2